MTVAVTLTCDNKYYFSSVKLKVALERILQPHLIFSAHISISLPAVCVMSFQNSVPHLYNSVELLAFGGDCLYKHTACSIVHVAVTETLL